LDTFIKFGSFKTTKRKKKKEKKNKKKRAQRNQKEYALGAQCIPILESQKIMVNNNFKMYMHLMSII
jgi:hypothetical protein